MEFRIWNMVILILLVAGIIILEIVLAKRENKWVGLILPGIFFILSFISVLNVSATGLETTGELIVLVISVFLLYNIPTLVLLGVYFAFRKRDRKKKELEKMSIQDLD